MNALIERSEKARAELMNAAGMDELTYHLMVLEAGCKALDETVRAVGATVNDELREVFRAHLTKQGWWTWWEMLWRSFEVRLAAEWTGPDSLVPAQSPEWKRQRLHEEALTLYYTDHYHRAFDLWLKMLEDRGAHRIPVPTTQPKDQHQHDHVH